MNSIQGLWRSLRTLRGNQRACVIAEPLWSIPYNLFLPFASVYMAAVGLTDAQIGAIASLGLAAQFLWGLISGAIIDRFGRRRTMLLFSLVSWTIPCALWAAAQNPWYFAVAAAFNGMWRVTGNCFSCTIVEDEDPGQLVQVYTLLNILGLAAGFLAPLAGLAIGRFSIVPTMRAICALALVLMTAKFFLLYHLSRESGVGKRRTRETKGQSLVQLAFGGWPAFVSALRKRRTRLCVALMVLFTCYSAIQASFWPLFVKAAYGVSDAGLSAFPPVRTVVSLLVYLLITARIDLSRIRRPLLLGIAAQGAGLALPMIFLPMAGHAVWAVFFSAACDAFALAMLGPVGESLMSLSIPGEERARINSLIIAGILLVSAPAGWIAGQLAGLSRALPLALNLCLVAAEAAVALWIAGEDRRAQAQSGG